MYQRLEKFAQQNGDPNWLDTWEAGMPRAGGVYYLDPESFKSLNGIDLTIAGNVTPGNVTWGLGAFANIFTLKGYTGYLIQTVNARYKYYREGGALEKTNTNQYVEVFGMKNGEMIGVDQHFTAVAFSNKVYSKVVVSVSFVVGAGTHKNQKAGEKIPSHKIVEKGTLGVGNIEWASQVLDWSYAFEVRCGPPATASHTLPGRK